MQIVDYELYLIPPRWCFLKLVTDDGIEGWGEPATPNHARTTMTATKEILDNYLVGKDASEIERHWQAMFRGRYYRGGPILMSAIAGIDQALWDIKGQYHDVPVYELLGGRARERVQVYEWIEGETEAEIARSAREAVDNGYSALKMAAISNVQRIDTPHVIAQSRNQIGAVRDAVGDKTDLIVDFRGRVTKAMTRWLADELDEFGIMFYEDPIPPDVTDVLAELRSHSRTPLASGERLYSRWDFDELVSRGLVDVIQPNLSHAGGITEVQKIASAAETKGIVLAPQCSFGPIALAACVQLDTVVPNVVVQGQEHGLHSPESSYHLSFLDDPTVFRYDDSYIQAPDTPGLGLTIDEDVVRSRAEPNFDWENPIWFYDDGSVSEW